MLGRPSHPPSSYHPKGGLIGILWYRFESLYTAAAMIYIYIYTYGAATKKKGLLDFFVIYIKMSMGSGEPESGRRLLGEAASERFGAKCFSGVEIYMPIYIHTPQSQQVPLVSVAISVLSDGHRATGRGLIMPAPPAPPAPIYVPRIGGCPMGV